MKSNFSINERGFWETADISAHGFDEPLAVAVGDYLIGVNCQSVMDFGCGTAEYAKKLATSGLEVSACDGNPNTPTITGEFAHVCDLSKLIEANFKYDWVISLEVGEHIPASYEQVFIDNISKSAVRGIVISWAVEGQAGDGHVNCRNNDYIIGEMAKRGWSFDRGAALDLRQKATFSWFQHTIMVFRNNGNYDGTREV